MGGSGGAEGGVFNEFVDGRARDVIQARDIGTLALHYHGALDHRVALHALPAAVADFIDREPELGRIDSAVAAQRQAGQPAVVVLAGLPGIGRRAAAVRWAHDRRERFPDGRLFVDFSGPGSRDVTSPADLLAALLRQLGLPDDDIPRAYADRHAVWRDRTAEGRILLVLANVRAAGQVEQALPPSREATVLVTTDHDLSAVTARHGAERVSLRPLDERAARELLTRLAGAERAAAEPDATRALLDLCGGWPLALRVAGGWLKSQPGREIAAAVRRLLAARRRADDEMGNPAVGSPDDDPGNNPSGAAGGGGGGEWQMEAVSDAAYAALPEPARRAYRLLGLHPAAGDRPGPAEPAAAVTFVLPAAAALLGAPADEAADTLETLIDWELLDRAGGGRYSFHDRIRRHAHRQARQMADDERAAAARRAVGWYLGAAVAADLTVNPYRPTFGPAYDRQRERPPPFGTDEKAARKRAMRWLEIEHRNLCAATYAAADRGWDDLVVQLCEAQWGLQLSVRPYGTLIPVLRTGLAAARRTGDPRWVFRLATQLGRGLFETEDFTAAREVLAEGLAAARETGEPLHEATALEFTGRSHLDAGEFADALPYFTRARDLEDRHGRARGVAINLHHIARARLGMGDGLAAYEACVAAYDRFGEVSEHAGTPRPDLYNQARVSLTTGRALLVLDRTAPALAALRAALQTMRDEGRTYQEAQILEELANAAPDPGDRAAYLDQAIAAYTCIGSPRATHLNR